MFVHSNRDRVGLYGPLAGVVAGSVGVLLGLRFALEGAPAGLVALHLRTNLLGFLGLTIVGALASLQGLGTFGRVLALAGSLLYAGLIVGLFNERYWTGDGPR